jgi:hypothetical protein
MKTFLKVWLGVAFITMGIGIVLLIITLSAGVSFADFTMDKMIFAHRNRATYSLNESYQDVKNIDFNFQYGNVEIVKGNSFSIDAWNYPKDNLRSYVSNGTWYIEEDKSKEYVRILGFEVPAKEFYGWRRFAPEIRITIPEDFEASDFNLVVSAGDVTVEEIMAQKGYLEVSAGRISIDKLQIKESSEYHIGAGQIKIKNADIKDIEVECSVGSVVIEGTVTGDNDITCDIGSVKFELDGEEEDYSYDVNVDIGNIKINHKNYHNLSDKVYKHNGADNKLSLNCNIGNITVDFN